MLASEASRLTRPAVDSQSNPKTVAAHNARKLDSRVLITNEGGEHAWLNEDLYRLYLKGGIAAEHPARRELVEKGFIRDQLDFKDMAARAVEKNLLRWRGPNVHTVVVTLRCNFKCLYCHASVVNPLQTDKDMTVAVARQTVDFIFQSQSPSLMIEFQGGEPLLNWPVVKFIVNYARRKNKIYSKDLHFGLISNFSLLDEEKVNFLIENKVSFCTSLDGPENLHNKNRLYLGGNSHQQVLAGLRQILARRAHGAAVDVPNAICTVTRFSLPFHREIIDQLVELGLERVQIGPLDPIGFARNSWNLIGYSSAEFIDFYSRALDYIIELNRRGVKAYEKTALILLIRILERGHWRFPNVDVACRLAFNYNGDIYTCEEGRLLANAGDEFFKIGHVSSATLPAALDHTTARASLLASSAATQPQCFQCAYNPYCTVLPVYNHQTQGSLWGHMPTNGWCEKMMGLFDLVFRKLQDPHSRPVLESWLEYKNR